MASNALRSQNYPRAQASGQPIQIEVSNDGTGSTPVQRFRATPLIVRGTVAEVHSSRWNTPNGQLPPGTTPENIPFERAIYTDYTINVTQAFRGAVSLGPIRVRTLGGRGGEDSYQEDFDARFTQGQQVILLLSRDEDPLTQAVGPEHYKVQWGFRGKYEIRGAEAVSEDRRQAKVVHKLALAELVAFIRANPYTPPPAGTAVPAGTTSP